MLPPEKWSAELPSVDVIKKGFQGSDPADTKARQGAVLSILCSVIQGLNGDKSSVDPSGSTIAEPARPRYREYMAAWNALGFSRKQFHYAHSSDFQRNVFEKYLSPPTLAGYQKSGTARLENMTTEGEESRAEREAAVQREQAEKAARAQEQEAQKAAERKATEAEAAKIADPDIAAAGSGRGGTELTVFGLQLGQRLSLPVCQSKSFGILLIDVDKDKEPCRATDDPSNTTIRFLGEHALPAWASSAVGGPEAVLKAGRLLALNFYGVVESDALFEGLTKKYGKPTRVREKNFQNTFGAKSKAADWEWSKPGLHVEFIVNESQPKMAAFYGALRFELASVWAARMAAERAEQEGRTKL